MPSAREIAYYASTAVVVLLYTFAGTTKISPLLSPEMHQEMVHEFSVYASKTPIRFLKLDPDVYRVLVGTVELTCVAAILFSKRKFAIFATWLLALIMVGAALTHILVSDPPEKTLAPVFCIIPLLTRLYTVGSFKVKTG